MNRKIAVAFSLHSTHNISLYEGGGFVGYRSLWSKESLGLGRDKCNGRGEGKERDHLNFMRAKWYSGLHLVSFYYRYALQGRKGVREHQKGENKSGDGIAFLFRDRSHRSGVGGGGSLSL